MVWDQLRNLFSGLRPRSVSRNAIRQPHPQLTRDDVERIIRRDFPRDFGDAFELLSNYSNDVAAVEARVRMACLKFSNGNLERLRQGVEIAQMDSRDVLVVAEYPEYHKRVEFRSELRETEIQAIIDRDWKQYQDWLKRE